MYVSHVIVIQSMQGEKALQKLWAQILLGVNGIVLTGRKKRYIKFYSQMNIFNGHALLARKVSQSVNLTTING